MLPKIKTILYATGMGAGAPHVFRYALALAKQHDAQKVFPPWQNGMLHLVPALGRSV